MSASLQISLLQHRPTPGDLTASLERLDEQSRQAASLGSRLLIVPECSLSGYNITLEERDRVAMGRNGELTDAVRSMARQHGIAIHYGFIEHNPGEEGGDDKGDRYYNAVQLVDADGDLRYHYRKTHLWGDLDRELFLPGDRFCAPIDLDGWRVAPLICYDVEFPEAVRYLALEGTELLVVSTALMTPWTTVADLTVPARAFESQLYVAYCNYCGSENGIDYVGHSGVGAPDGSLLQQAGNTPTLLTATLSRQRLTDAREALPYYADRRPALYRHPRDETHTQR